MELLRTNKVDAAGLAHSHSSANLSKSISGASLSSSQATHRTQCSSGLSSVSGRLANLSSSPASPTGDVVAAGAAATTAAANTTAAAGSASGPAAASAAATEVPPRAAAPVAGGGKTVLAGVAPSCFGKLRRRARFSWKEPVYYELRSTALLTFGDKGGGSAGAGAGGASGANNGGHHGSSSFASLAAKIMHPRQSAQAGVDWSWHADLCGAERVVEQPSQTKKDLFAFAVEFPSRERKKPLLLAAASAAERKRWMAAMDRARRCVQPNVSLSLPLGSIFSCRLMPVLSFRGHVGRERCMLRCVADAHSSCVRSWAGVHERGGFQYIPSILF